MWEFVGSKPVHIQLEHYIDIKLVRHPPLIIGTSSGKSYYYYILYIGKCLQYIYLANFASKINSFDVENSIILLYNNVKF